MNRLFKYIAILLSAGLVNSFSLLAQSENKEKTAEQATPANHPVEFPSMTVEGREQLRVQAGVKLYPTRVKKLSPAEIDSIRPVHKQQAFLLPIKPLVSVIERKYYLRNYLDIYAGNYLTLSGKGGVEFAINDFKMSLDARALYTDGHVKNAQDFDGGVKLGLSYIAPKKYWIFGGSKTYSYLDIGRRNYNMYAMDTAFARDAFNVDLGVISDGEYGGYIFSTGASYSQFNLEHNMDLAENSNLSGFLRVGKYVDSSLLVGGDVSIRLGTTFGNPNNFSTFAAYAKYSVNKDLIIDGKAGLQTAGSSEHIQRANVLLQGEANFLVNKFVTLNVGANTNFLDNSFRNMWQINRFLEHRAKVDYAYEKALNAAIILHPNEMAMFSAGAKVMAIDRMRTYTLTNEKYFSVDYADASGMDLFAKGSFLMGDGGNLSGELHYETFKYADGEHKDKVVQFTSPISFRASYFNVWMKKIGTNFELNYFGNRYLDPENTKEANAFVDLSVKVSYEVINNLKVYLKGENLLNSNIAIWGPYRERDIFLSLGAFWKF